MKKFSRTVISGILFVSLLLPSFLIPSLTPLQAVESEFGGPLQSSDFSETVGGSSGSSGGGSSSVTTQSVGIGGGVGSAVGNIGACALVGLVSLGAALGIGAAATGVSTAQAVLPTGIFVQDKVMNFWVGPQIAAQTATAASTQTQTLVECFLDGLVVLAREVLIAQLTASIVNWINGGFDGNPSFIEDPQQFLTDVADQTIGEFIGGVGLSFVCSPFQLQIKRALTLSYGTSQRNACTLSKVVKNIDNFLKGGWSDDSWDGWFAVSRNPTNTFAGSYLEASSQLSISITNAQGQQVKLLDWGDGFLSYTKCEVPATASSPGKNCKIVTPGSVVVDQLNQTLFSGQQRLAMASQINQIVGALVNQAMNHIFSSGGLLGQSKNSYGNSSPLSQTVNLAQKENLNGQQNLLLGTLENARQNTQTMGQLSADGLSRVTKSKGILSDVQTCYRDKLKTGILTSDQRSLAQDRIALASTTIETNLSSYEKNFSAKITDMLNANGYIATLLKDIHADVTGLATQQATQKYSNLTAGGFVPSTQNINNARFELEGIKTTLDQLDIQSQQKLDQCTAFPGN